MADMLVNLMKLPPKDEIIAALKKQGVQIRRPLPPDNLFRIVRVKTVPRKNPVRIIAEFSRVRCPEAEDVLLTIQNEGKYTEEYLSLTHDFYLFA